MLRTNAAGEPKRWGQEPDHLDRDARLGYVF
jgi:hypothetical protein